MSKERHASLKEMEEAALQLLRQGNFKDCFGYCCVALQNENASRMFCLIVAQIMPYLTSYQFNPIIKNALFRTIECEGVEAQKLAVPWIGMVHQDPAFAPVLVFAQDDYSFRPEHWADLEPCMTDSFFMAGLERLVAEDKKIELALTNLRKALLLDIRPSGLLKTKHLNFLCALAEHCHGNEYVFAVSDAETDAVQKLGRTDPFDIVLFACYESLFGQTFNAKASSVSGFRQLVKTQVKEREEEQALKDSIPALGAIRDNVSLRVRDMYEGNPYPRWRTLNAAAAQSDIDAEILVAGCGTGRFLIELALLLPRSRFTAIDITRASLAYAMRMAHVYGAANIDFAQCDILDIAETAKTFDFINCSGVLHHMADPAAGWQCLIERLNPGGVMFIGLYSTYARRAVAAARAEICARNVVPDAQGIRNFRKYIFSLPAGHAFQRLLRIRDFYGMSEARDLLFHVQEKTYTIPELAQMLDRLGLEFLGFQKPKPEIERMYRERYADDPFMRNLTNWHALETDHPDAFIDMYNFLCKKKDDTTRNVRAERFLQAGFLI